MTAARDATAASAADRAPRPETAPAPPDPLSDKDYARIAGVLDRHFADGNERFLALNAIGDPRAQEHFDDLADVPSGLRPSVSSAVTAGPAA